MSFRRLLFTFVIAFAAAVVFVPGASAGSIADYDPCPKSGADLVCPDGQVGVSYSIKFHGDEQPICRPGDDQWFATNGTVPPGLSLATDGTLSGMPTQAGAYAFWLELKLPDHEGCSSRDNSEEHVSITIKPGTLPPPPPPALPRLIIGPEVVSPGTVGTPYMAAMTANLPDAKTWSIVAGVLPAGLNLGPTSGVISGAPAVPGSYSFTVRAQIADGRSDTKSLTLEVRDRLRLAGAGDLETRVFRTEVGVEFDGGVLATGGFGTYTWSVEGDLPLGLTLDEAGGITGSPEEAGSYRFTVLVTDAESRRALYRARIIVAERLALKTAVLKPGKVGRFLTRKVATIGGVGPTTTRVTRGPLPRGLLFDRVAGIFVGSPTKAGTWRIRVEVADSLGVKARGFVILVIRK